MRATRGRAAAIRAVGWVLVALGVILPGAARAASYATRNFQVEAPTAEAAKRVGDHAEACRQAIARAWLGRELPDWPRRCPIRVELTGGEAGGITSFSFDRGRVADQDIKVEGRLDRILASALPHEVTHTIFAAYFGGPMPRWADEGASLLSEDRREKDRHDRIVHDLLRKRTELPLRTLFAMEDYPRDLMGFYGQGYGVSKFLIAIGGRPRFLAFVKAGQDGGWDAAAAAHYGLADCRELDRAWRSWQNVQLAARADGDPDAALAQAQAASAD
jgi:hypothetical protein